MTTRQGPGNTAPGLDHTTADSSAPPPTLTLYERHKRHIAYWSSTSHIRALGDACHDLNAKPSRRGRPKVHPDRVIHVLLALAFRAHHPGVIADSTVTQLCAETALNEQRVKDALTVATTMGLVVTVDKARRPKPNARGRAPHRHLAYLVRNGEQMLTTSPPEEMVRIEVANGEPVRTTTTDEMVRIEAVNGEPVRTPLLTDLVLVDEQLGATSAAKPRADDGATYAEDKTELRRLITAELARRHGGTEAAMRIQYRPMIEVVLALDEATDDIKHLTDLVDRTTHIRHRHRRHA